MKKIVVLPSFDRSVKHLTSLERKLLGKSLERFNQYLVTGVAPSGFRLKKINHDKYEFRVDIRLRVIIKGEGDIFYLVLIGNHEDVRRYLRNYR